MGRDLAYYWEYIQITDTESSEEGEREFTIFSQDLDERVTEVDVRLTVINWKDQIDRIIFPIKVLPTELPVVKITGDSVREMEINQGIEIGVDAYFQACSENNKIVLASYQWTQVLFFFLQNDILKLKLNFQIYHHFQPKSERSIHRREVCYCFFFLRWINVTY
jgi:hypothetical protein